MITPNGKTAPASSRSRTDRTGDQPGNQRSRPAIPGAGSCTCMTRSSSLPSRRPSPPPTTARNGPLYFMFGKPGSAACAGSRKGRRNELVTVGQRCLLVGPERHQTGPARSGYQPAVTRIRRRDPRRATRDHRAPGRPGQLHPSRSASADPNASSTCSRTTSRCSATTSPTRSRASTRRGNARRHVRLHRPRQEGLPEGHQGNRPPRPAQQPAGETRSQHFAVALDRQLITAPSIDYTQYPDGIPADQGSEITGGFTITSAQDLATSCSWARCRSSSKLISDSQVSATLGKQALHQGLVAGLVGLARGVPVPARCSTACSA